MATTGSQHEAALDEAKSAASAITVEKEHEYNELASDIKQILGDMDNNGIYSKKIARVVGPINVKLEEMSSWRVERLEQFVEQLALESVPFLSRLAVTQRFISSLKKKYPKKSNGV